MVISAAYEIICGKTCRLCILHSQTTLIFLAKKLGSLTAAFDNGALILHRQLLLL